MSEVAALGSRSPWRVRPDEGTRAPAVRIDAPRALQLALAGLWVLDGVLQYQPAMFTPAFSRMLAAGNPPVIARPAVWDATLVGQHLVPLNTAFAAIQMLLVALAVALALVAVGVYLPALLLAVVLAAVIWVFVQAFGGILASGATDPNSGPLLALLALAYWPSARPAPPGPAAATHGMVAG